MKSKNIFFLTFSILLSLSFLSACKTTTDTTDPVLVATEDTPAISHEASEVDDTPISPMKNDSLLLSMERTPCYGTCPTYKFHIYKNGYTEYEGIRFVNKEGMFYTILSKEQLKKITDRAKEIKFYYFKDEYIDRNMTDFPTTIIKYNLEGNMKTVLDGHNETPRDLKEFELFLDQIIDNSVWMKK